MQRGNGRKKAQKAQNNTGFRGLVFAAFEPFCGKHVLEKFSVACEAGQSPNRPRVRVPMLKIIHCRLLRTDLRARMPFKYGITTMTEVPHVFVIVRLAIDDGISEGIAADHLPPKWFTKQPERDTVEEIGEMVQVIRHAMGLAEGMSGRTVFDLWRRLYEEQSRWAKANGVAALLAHFGTSPVERA